MWGWMELAIWSRALGIHEHVRQSVVQNAGNALDINFGGLGPWAPRDGARELVPLGMDGVILLEQDLWQPKNMCAKVRVPGEQGAGAGEQGAREQGANSR